MKYYLFAAVMLSLNLSSFANAYTPPPHDKEKETFLCEFKLRESEYHHGLKCEAKATVVIRNDDDLRSNHNEREKNTLAVRCSNGFTLLDRNASVAAHADDLVVFGEEENEFDRLALLEIEEAAEESHRTCFNASLMFSPKPGVSERLDGNCVRKMED